VLGLITGAGVALAAGLGYLLGLRHGRTEIVLAGDPATRPPGAALAFVERFHTQSSHTRAGLQARAPSTEWGPAVAPIKTVQALRRLARWAFRRL
jgi:hypothetical protein